MALKTINIKGKEYVQVAERIRHFRTSDEYKGWAIETEWLRIDEEVASYEEMIRARKEQIINSINLMIDEENRTEYEKIEFSMMSLEELEEIEKQLEIQEKNKICKSIVQMCTQEDIGEILKKYRTNNLGNLDLRDLKYLHDRIVISNQTVTKKDIQELKKIADTLGTDDIERYVEKNYKKKLEELTKKEYKKIKKILNS